MAKKIKKRIKTKHFSELIPGRVKMSEVLLDYAEPLLREADNMKSREVAISMATICWNISLMPEDEQKEMIENALAEISKSGDYDTTKSINDDVNRT